MAIDPLKIFSVLIGINEYNGTAKNLHGCINDVDILYKSLEKLGVPSANITTLKSPPTSTSPEPTRSEVIEQINKTALRATNAGPGSLFFLHYSGHGDRMQTKFPERKGPDGQDEVLCLLEEELRDVEIDNIINHLTSQGLTVILLFDCCHSGSADRNSGEQAVRSRSRSSQSFAQDAPPSSSNRGCRDATELKSWLYRKREHNFFSACQIDEFAVEWSGPDKNIYGAMTYHFAQALDLLASRPVDSLDNEDSPKTYGQLIQHIKALCTESNIAQRPVHLGDKDRFIFSAQKLDRAPRGLSAKVIKLFDASMIQIDRGTVHGVTRDDRFCISPPRRTQTGLLEPKLLPAVEAVVVKSEDQKATLEIVSCATTAGTQTLRETVEIGWCAELSGRGRRFIGLLKGPEGLVDATLSRWQYQFPDLLKAPVKLTASSGVFDISVEIGESGPLTFRDVNGQLLPNIPDLHMEDEGFVLKLAYLLPHLCSFQKFVNLEPASDSSVSHIFRIEDLDLSESMIEDDDVILAGKRLLFENKGTRPVYITVFDLGPAYGILQLFPEQCGDSEPAFQNKPIPVDFCITPPKILKSLAQRPGYTQKDIYKVLITSQPTDFRHYAQPNLEEWSEWERNQALDPQKLRDGKVLRRRSVNFQVAHETVITTAPTAADD
ncbi:Metacaspase-3 [Arthrobotrys entomopaga]|nr:Metacaspase-3 [Arthrobotrys entomopaga]